MFPLIFAYVFEDKMRIIIMSNIIKGFVVRLSLFAGIVIRGFSEMKLTCCGFLERKRK